MRHEGPVALSFAQQRLWFLAQLDSRASSAYHIPGGVRLNGTLDTAALQAALDRIVARHAALRTRFVTVDGQPMQVADAASGFALSHVDLRDDAQPEQALARLSQEEASAPFDLEHGPLIRGRLLRLAEDEHVLLVTMHHIVSDGWSMGVLINEFSALYAAFAAGRPDPLPALRIQYTDYSAWQRRWLDGALLQRQQAFWSEHLAGAPALLELPTDRLRPPAQDYAGARLAFTLDAELGAGLKALSQRHGSTLFMTLLAAWATLLGRLSGQTDVVIGTPVANRTRSEVEPLIGFFVNTQALRVDLSGSPTVGDLLAQVRRTALAAQTHQDLPFEQVVEALQPVRSMAHSPVFQTMLAWQNTPQGSLDLPGLQLQALTHDTITTQFDLTLDMHQAGDLLAGSFTYATALFDAATIARWSQCWQNLLRAMVQEDSRAVDQLALLSDAERQQVLYGFNDTAAPYPADRCIHELFEAQVQASPDACALVFEDTRLSYAQLNERANQLAHHLIALGVQPDDRVAIALQRSCEMVVALLATLKAGAAYVPLDPDYPADRLAFMLADSAPKALLTHSCARPVLGEVAASLEVIDLDAEHQPWASLSSDNPDPRALGLCSSHLAYVIYTSGSTGSPKGVLVEHRNIHRLIINNGYADFCAEDRVAFASNPSFDAITMEIWAPLVHGGCVVVVHEGCLLDPQRLAQVLREQRVSALFVTTALFNLYARTASTAFKGLRFLLCGGEQATPGSFAKILNQGAPQHLIHCYGPTETTTFAITHDVQHVRDGAHNIPLGRPIANTQIYILDAHGEPVPVGVSGELYIGGTGVARGYLNRPELTAERFLADPFALAAGHEGARMYRTGDLGRWLPDGTIEFLGRNDHQVKIRGFRIELGEIEARLLAVPGVREAVVLAREDVAGDKRLVAYYCGTEVPASELRAALSGALPEYMVPAAYVHLDGLPLTPNGKLDRRALPAPDGDAFGARAFEPPVGPVECALAAIWCELLGVERVGRNDHFFELGGHSLLAVTMIERMRALGWQLEVRALFQTPTLAGLAASVGASSDREPANLIPAACTHITPDLLPLVALTQPEIDRVVQGIPGGAANVQDIYPLAPLQEGIFFHHLMSVSGDAYLLPSLLAFDSRDRLDRFLGALQQVIDRHDILRTSVAWEGLAEPVQVVWRQAPLQVQELSFAQPDVAAALLEHCDPRRVRLDVRQAPLMRAHVAHDGANQRWLLLMLQHHLAIDHTTLELIIQEVQAHLGNQADRLAPALPFRNFVAQARLGLSRAEHEAYFTGMLGDIDEPTAPFGLLDVQGDGSGVEEAWLTLDSGLSRRLRAQSRRLGVSAASLFHLAWAQLLARTSGRTDVVFGTVLFGRMQGGAGADRALGMFINTLPLRLTLDDTPLEQAVRHTHARLAELLRHEHASLALAQRCSAVPAPAPLFTALLNYRHSAAAAASEDLLAWEGMQVLHGGEERTNYPFTLSVDDLGEGFSLNVQTLAAVDPTRVCAMVATVVEDIVQALEQAPQRAARSLQILPDAERQQVLYDFNDTAAPYPAERCIHELFEAQVQASPDACALVYEDTRLSYAQLNERANQLAHHLIALGVQPDDRVAIALHRSCEMVIALLATLKAGAAYVPLDPDYPTDRLAFMLADSAPKALLTQAAVCSTLGELPSSLAVIDLDAGHQPWASLSSDNPDPRALGLSSSHLAYVIYTSGSTGSPKGVLIEHGNVVRLFSATHPWFNFDASDVWTLFHSYAFDFSVWEMWGALVYGGRLIIPSHLVSRSPADFYRLLCEQRVTVLNQTPSAFSQLLAAQADSTQAHSLRHVVFGGEALEVAKLEPWFAGNDAAKTQLTNMYGITETTVHVTYRPLQSRDIAHRGSSPIGQCIPDLRAYILDEQGQPVPIGVTGELYIGGTGVARGYLNRPELTAERFLADPFALAAGHEGARMYRTGDLGRWLPDGTIEFLGRNDHQVKIRGFRIELGEIEARLLAVPGVREAVVLAREDVAGDKRLVAYYCGTEVPASELRAALSGALPEYMVPAAYVHLDGLPLTPNGKLDRRALPAPDGDAFGARAFEPPVGPVECALAAIWCELLGVERVGRNDHFFELGGHSLLAVTMIERMRALGWQLEVRALFQTPTLAGLAASVGASSDREPANLIPAACTHITPDLLPLVALTQPEIDRVVQGIPGGAANVQDIYPLAPLQEGIFFHHLMSVSGDAYLLPSLLAFDSRDRLDRFLGALQQVIDRHDILRTSVAWEGLAEPVQVVWRQAPLQVQELSFAQPDVAAALLEHCDPRRVRLDVRQAPLMRAHVAHDGANQRWLLLMLQHHLAIDHTTLELIIQEVQAHLGNQADRLAPALPFRNFVAQARLGLSRAEHEAYFTGMLGDIDEPTAPFGLLDVQGDGSGVEEAWLTLDSGLSRRLRAQSRRLGVSAASLFHLAWAQLLARTSGRTDVVFGTVLFGRMQGGAGADRALGMFINTLPLRLTLDDTPLEQAVRHTHARLAELLRHEHASLALAQRCSAVPAPAPLFTALLNYRHVAEAVVHAESAEGDRAATWEGIKVLYSGERTNYPLSLSVGDLGEDFSLNVQTLAAVDPTRVCTMLCTVLDDLAQALEHSPQRAVRTLEVLPDAERQQVLYGFNDTAAPYPADRCIHELFEAQVQASPDACALVFEDTRLSYAQLNERANQLAHHLIALGVQPDDRVAIALHRSCEMVIALLATLKAGAAYVPLDPDYPADRLAFMLADSAPKALLTQAAVRSTLGELPSSLEAIDLDAGHQPWAGLSTDNPDPRALGLGSSHLAYVIYTSGSTGTPKGVMVEHRNVVKLVIDNGYATVDRDDHVALAANPAFDATTFELWGALLNGATSVVIGQATLLDPVRFAAALQQHAVTVLWMTVSLFNHHCNELTGVLPQLRYLLVGGEALDPRVIARVVADCAPQHLLNGYGPTETTTFAITHDVRHVEDGARSIPLGRPIANTQIYILDAQGQPVPIGVTGELYIGGAGVARGYLNRPELTAERFLADPYAVAAGHSGARMYRTGDLGRWLPDGTIEFLGRNDHQVKIRGFRIELGEIEARLQTVPGVREAVVLAREDVPGDKRLVAYYCGAELDPAELRSALSGALPEYMVPAAYVHMDGLPLTPNGKLDRRALPAPDGDAFGARAFEPPVGPVECALATIWSELLGIERVGRNDHFFELGGHSLLAVSMFERMRALGWQLEARALFQTPTLTGLAASVGAADDSAPTNLIPADCTHITPDLLPLVALTQPEIDRVVQGIPGGAANVQDIYPLAPLQEGFFFHHLMSSAGDAYLLPSLLAFDSRDRLDRFLGALQQVIDRHDILRTSVAWEGLAEPVQVVWRQAPLQVQELSFAQPDVAAALLEHCDPRRVRLDVRQAPLMRAHVAHDGANQRWLLLMLQHHLAIDHTTLELIIQEVQAHLGNQADRLAPALPFRNFVAQARLGLSRAEHEAFFTGMLGDIDEPTAPFGLLDAQRDGSGIEEIWLTLECGLARRLRAQSRRLGVSAASLFHLAWAQLLARTSGRTDVVFGTVMFGRMQGGAGADRALGMFINTLPLRLTLDDTPLEQAVRHTHARLAELLRHEHASLALAQRCSAVPAPAPLFTALLNYRHSAAADPQAASAWAGIQLLDGGGERNNYPLTLSVDDLGEDFSLNVQTLTAVDPTRVCTMLCTVLDDLAQALEHSPQRAVRTLEVLPDAERQQVLYGFNDTAAPYPADRCIHELFEAQVQASPDACALVFEDTRLSYAQLNERANQLAHHLIALGVQPDDRVAIALHRSCEMVIALLATLKAGAAYVPLDPDYPTDRLAFMLADSAPKALLTQAAVRSTLGEPPSAVALIELDAQQQPWAGLSTDNPDPRALGLSSSHLAYVIYTSGSTGTPKGVAIEHRSAFNFLCWARQEFDADDLRESLFSTSINFDKAVYECFLPLVTGRTAHIVPNALALIGHSRDVTLINTVPSAMTALVKANAVPAATQVVNLAGEVLRRDLVERLFAQAGVHTVCNLYGPSETTTYSTWTAMRREDGFSPHIGRPIANTQIYILDAQGEPVPVGVAGELYIGGAGVARGYLNRPELTAERFLADPYAVAAGNSGARMYRTGDLGRWLPDGTIEFLGRNDHQVKIRGFRIELGEIEARLQTVPGVREAVVLAREDVPGDKRLVAYYCGAELDPAELGSALSGALPEYMVPAAYVHMDGLPLTPNGKLDRRALPAPDGDAFGARAFEPPVGPVECALATIWSELLGIERVGRNDHFFELGGHSLLAVQLISKAQSAGFTLTLSHVFQCPTLAQQAAAAKPLAQQEPGAHAIPIRTTGRARPLFLLHMASGEVTFAPGLTEHIDANVPVYALPGPDKSQAPQRTMETAAKRLIPLIREVQPTGPYRLAGWSYGGVLAYELAAQLAGLDETVELLGLIDTPLREARLAAHAPSLQTPEFDAAVVRFGKDPASVERLRQRLAELPSASTGASKLELLRPQADDLSDQIAAALRNVSTDEALQWLQHWHTGNQTALNYAYRPIPVALDVLVADESVPEFGTALGWDKLVPPDLLNITLVPGSHLRLMQEPYVSAIGAALSAALARTSTSRADRNPAAHNPVIPIQPGRRQHTPLYCIPGAGANIFDFRHLGAAFGPRQPLVGLQPRGLQEPQAPHASVEAAAAFNIAAVQRHQPEGHLHLLGHSFGAWVAFEMALQLQAAGRRVLTLTLVDAEPPDDGAQQAAEYNDLEIMLELIGLFNLRLSRPVDLTADDLAGLSTSHALAMLHARLIRAGALPHRSRPETLAAVLRSFAANRRTSYAPKAAFAGAARVISAGRDVEERVGDGLRQGHSARSWHEFVPAAEWICCDLANHITVLQPPHVETWVRQLGITANCHRATALELP